MMISDPFSWWLPGFHTHRCAEDIVRSELKDRSTGLGSVTWYRAVLDEAHVIKGHKQARRDPTLLQFCGDRPIQTDGI